MKSAEAGTNWAVMRGFIPDQLAKTAGREALFLSALSRCVLIDFAYRERQWDNEGLSVITVKPAKLAVSPFAPVLKALQEVYERTEAEVGNRSGKYYVNSYGAGGSTTPHIDREADKTLGVGLVGRAEAVIHDPGTGETHTLELNPTDAIYFDNSVPPVERPVHQVRNTLVMPRRALVNG